MARRNRSSRRLKRKTRKTRRRVKRRNQRGGDGVTAIPEGYPDLVRSGPPEGPDRLGESYTESEPIDGISNPKPNL